MSEAELTEVCLIYFHKVIVTPSYLIFPQEFHRKRKEESRKESQGMIFNHPQLGRAPPPGKETRSNEYVDKGYSCILRTLYWKIAGMPGMHPIVWGKGSGCLDGRKVRLGFGISSACVV